MRVCDLIKILKEMPKDAQVVTNDGNGWLADKIIIHYDKKDKIVEILGEIDWD